LFHYSVHMNRSTLTIFTPLHLLLFIVVLGLELRAYILSHYTSPIFVKGFLR
jgi:hypothetical protein